MGRYDYDDMPTRNTKRGRKGNKTTFLFTVFFILVALIIIVVYLILNPEKKINIKTNSTSSVESSSDKNTDNPLLDNSISKNTSNPLIDYKDSDDNSENSNILLSQSEEEKVDDNSSETSAKPIEKTEANNLAQVEEEPAVEEPVVEEPIVDESVVEQPVAEEPIVEEPVVEEPIVEEPVVDEPVVDEPVVDEPVVEEPVAEEPVAEEPVAEEPVVEEPVAEEPVVEEPVAEEPEAEEPVAEEPVVEEPVVEEPVVEEPVVEEPVVEEPVVEEPVVEEPVAEEPVSGLVKVYDGESLTSDKTMSDSIKVDSSVVNNDQSNQYGFTTLPLLDEEKSVVVENANPLLIMDPDEVISSSKSYFEGENLVVTGKNGSAVRALCDGSIIKIGKNNGYKFVKLEDREGNIYTYSGFERIVCKSGTRVKKGAVLGSIGSAASKITIEYEAKP